MTRPKVSLRSRLQVSIKSIFAIMSIPSYLLRAFAYSAILLFILQWLFNFEILWAIIQTNPSQLPSVLIEGYLNLFRFGFDATPVLLVFIATLQGIGFAVLHFISRIDTGTSKRHSWTTLSVALIGSGCVACGGSILAPILNLFVSGASLVLSRFISDSILVFAAGLALYSVIVIGEKTATIMQSKIGN